MGPEGFSSGFWVAVVGYLVLLVVVLAALLGLVWLLS